MTTDAQPAPLPSPQAPTARADRALAPDIARGLVLLGIAVANVPFFLYGRELGILLKPVTDATADPWVNALVATLADNRSYPLFALLFGYGLTQLLTREQARGTEWPDARRLLLRRNAWLIAFGAAHGVLLFFGDILGTYGLLGLALVLLIRASGRTLAIVGWLSFGFLIVVGALEGLSGLLAKFGGGAAPSAALFNSAGAETFPLAVLYRLGEWTIGMISVPFGGLGLLAPMVLGMWAARYRVLENPVNHRRALSLVAGIGIPVSVLGALPIALALLGVIELSLIAEPFAAMLHAATGAVGGAAYVALIALIIGGRGSGRELGSPTAKPRGPISRMFAALGQRSLSGYLTQSLVFVIVFAPYGLGLGATASVAEATQIAVITWLGTLVIANVLAALDRSGPAEWLLRRAVYGRRG
ncbi:DUF418 domain-containing protein [Microcella sp.]|uniref:DUF418 domain-containing protein n=1 Tax=Microcella sp. TaxID=1913979 RepID=UPI00299F7B16|nr:DUF418 domain-containing protein [Microcella sp.]MDX2025888.1 DUF418 domain-containing protein [Microcella sp.]